MLENQGFRDKSEVSEKERQEFAHYRARLKEYAGYPAF